MIERTGTKLDCRHTFAPSYCKIDDENLDLRSREWHHGITTRSTGLTPDPIKMRPLLCRLLISAPKGSWWHPCWDSQAIHQLCHGTWSSFYVTCKEYRAILNNSMQRNPREPQTASARLLFAFKTPPTPLLRRQRDGRSSRQPSGCIPQWRSKNLGCPRPSESAPPASPAAGASRWYGPAPSCPCGRPRACPPSRP